MADLPNIKPGDRVTFEGEVLDVNIADHRIRVALDGRPELTSWVWVNTSNVRSHIPAPKAIKVGDTVKARDDLHCYRVVAIAEEGDEAWLRTSSGGNRWARLTDLTLIEDEGHG